MSCIESLYLEMCDHTHRKSSQDDFERWAGRVNRVACWSVGRVISVRMRDRGTARRVVVSGRVVSVEPVRLHLTRGGATVVWKVKLDTGHTVHVTKI